MMTKHHGAMCLQIMVYRIPKIHRVTECKQQNKSMAVAGLFASTVWDRDFLYI